MSHHGKSLTNGIPEGNLPGGNLPEGALPDAAANSPAEPSNPTHRASEAELKTQTNNAVGNGVSHRGDQRDRHPSFSTGKAGRGSTAGKAKDGGRSGPLGAAGRKSGPKSG